MYSSAEGEGTCSVSVDDSLDGPASDLQNDLLLNLLQQISESVSEGDDEASVINQPTDAQTDSSTDVKVKTEVVGPTTEELESFNELIQFDHVYYKPAVSLSAASNSSAAVTTKAAPSPKRAAVSIIKPTVRAATQVQQPTVPQPKQEPAPTELSFGEADLAGLSQSLEDLIDLDALLQEGIMSESSLCPVATALNDIASISSVDETSSRKRKLDNEDVIEKDACKKPLCIKSEFMDSSSNSDISSLFPTNDTFGLESGLSTAACSPVTRSSLSESGYNSDMSDAPSPQSDVSGGLADSTIWEESFSELFPSLV